METIAFGFAVSLSCLFLFSSLVPKKWKHDNVDYGYPTGLREKDEYGFQDTYNCRFCDKSITQDSTGAWFHLSQ